MRAQPANLIGGFYADDSLPWSAQDTVNWIPEVAEQLGTRTQAKLRGAPGLKLFAAIGSGPIRGAHNCQGRLFVVSSNTLYEVSAAGVATSRGTIPGVGLVNISNNQIPGGNQLVVVNGSSGYVWNTATQSFSKITDPGYPGAIAVDYVDTFMVQVEPFGRYWFHSLPADAMNYNTLDRYESEGSPDNIITAHVNQLEVVVFNQTTIEFFANTGASTGKTFASKRIVVDTGCAGRHSVAKLDNSLMWLGDDGVFYRLDGYSARPISTRPIEKAISEYNWSQAFATAYESEGHKICYWTFPDGTTFGYDVVTQLWTRRQSFGLNRWRPNTLTYWNRKWIAGDFQNGNLYEVDWETFDENGAPLVAERISGVTHSNQNKVCVGYAELIMDTGHGTTPDHSVEVTYSDDGGRNWSNWKNRSLGEIGEYRKRVKFFRLGSARQRTWRVRVSSPCKRDLLGAVVQIDAATG